MRLLFFIGLLCSSFTALAEGWTNTANITDIEIIRGKGLQIQGDFGNPSKCSLDCHNNRHTLV